MAIPPIPKARKKTREQRRKRFLVLINGIRPWEWCYLFSPPVVFALVYYQRSFGVPRMLTGYVFVFIVPYIGAWFMLLEWVRRRRDFEMTAIAKGKHKEQRGRKIAQAEIQSERKAAAKARETSRAAGKAVPASGRGGPASRSPRESEPE